MKKSNNILIVVLLLLCVIGLFDKSFAQSAKDSALKEMINSQRFVFVAQSATPMNGRLKQLTSDYSVIIKKDTVEAYLPYYGIAYSPSIGTNDGGIDFKTTAFTYTMKEAKKGGWDITITPDKIASAQKLMLSISAAGYATLDVNSNTRQSISFYGYIREIKKQ
jgi:hypothetical protein